MVKAFGEQSVDLNARPSSGAGYALARAPNEDEIAVRCFYCLLMVV